MRNIWERTIWREVMDEKLVKEVIFSFREVQRKTHHVLAEEAANREITTTQLLAIRELQKNQN